MEAMDGTAKAGQPTVVDVVDEYNRQLAEICERVAVNVEALRGLVAEGIMPEDPSKLVNTGPTLSGRLGTVLDIQRLHISCLHQQLRQMEELVQQLG